MQESSGLNTPTELTPEQWRDKIPEKERLVGKFELMTSQVEWPAIAYEKSGDFKKAAMWYLMYAGGGNAYKIFEEKRFTAADIKEVKEMAIEKLEIYADAITGSPMPNGDDKMGLTPLDYYEAARRYRDYAKKLKSEIN